LFVDGARIIVTKSSRVVGGTCSVDGEIKKNTYIILTEKREKAPIKSEETCVLVGGQFSS